MAKSDLLAKLSQIRGNIVEPQNGALNSPPGFIENEITASAQEAQNCKDGVCEIDETNLQAEVGGPTRIACKDFFKKTN